MTTEKIDFLVELLSTCAMSAVFPLLLLIGSAAGSSNCTQDRVAMCASDIATVRPCSAGVRCDAACSSQVHYARCLQASDCDADMYQALLDDCFLGRMHVASAALPGGAGSCAVFAGDDPAGGLIGCAWQRPLTSEEEKSLRHAVDSAHWEKRVPDAMPSSAARELTLLHARGRFLDLRDEAGLTPTPTTMAVVMPRTMDPCSLDAMTAALYDFCTAFVPPCAGTEFQKLNSLAERLSRQCNASHTPADASKPAVVGVVPFPRTEVTVVIRTVGRKSVAAAVRSALREGFPVLVVADGARAGRRAAATLEASKLALNVTFVEVLARHSPGPLMLTLNYLRTLDIADNVPLNVRFPRCSPVFVSSQPPSRTLRVVCFSAAWPEVGILREHRSKCWRLSRAHRIHRLSR